MPTRVAAMPDPDPPLSNGCAQVAALDRQTAAIETLTAEIMATRRAFTPAAEAITDLGAAQKKLCDFLVGNRLKISGAILAVLVAVSAISPNAAHMISLALAPLGLAGGAAAP